MESETETNDIESHLSNALSGVDSNEETVRASNNTAGHANTNQQPSLLMDLFREPPMSSTPPTPPPPPPPVSRPVVISRPTTSTARKQSTSTFVVTSPLLPRPQRGGTEREVSWGDANVPRIVFNEQQRSHSRNISNIPLELLNPYETEAETNILRAIQSRSPASMARKTPILAQVPDERTHNFEKTSDGGSLGTVENDLAGLTDALSVIDATHVPTDHPTGTSSLEGSAEISNEGNSVPSKKKSNEGSSTNGHTSSETKPLIGHIRQPTTVEVALDDLAGCLAAFHDIEQQKGAPGSVEGQANQRKQSVGASVDEMSESESQVGKGGPDQEPKPRLPQHNKSPNPDRTSRKATIAIRLCQCREFLKTFLFPRLTEFLIYTKVVLCYLMIPATMAACILYYLSGNPISSSGASISWWLLFVCVRQVITLSLALATQVFIIDFLALGTQVLLRTLGPIVTLVIVHARGWPFVACCWCLYDFGLLYGTRLAGHWMYWQDGIEVFSEKNPDGGILSHEWNKKVLLIGTTVSIVVTLKRFVVGLFLGRQTYFHHGEQLADLLNKILLVSHLASLAHGTKPLQPNPINSKQDSTRGLVFDDESDTKCSNSNTVGTGERVIDTTARDPLTGSLNHHEKMKLRQLLEQWEDPEKYNYEETNTASIAAVLKFRKALAFIQKHYPFSYSFGPAFTREECIESAQNLYDLLVRRSLATDTLQFETLALITLDKEGKIDRKKAKELMKSFRPDRDGNLKMLDFVRSVDAIYKEYKFLNASIENAGTIDHQIESVFNCVFYGCIVIVIVSQLGFDPFALFLSLSSVIVAFAFMIGNSASKFVDGITFIVGRRPMNIGDGVCFGEPNSPLELDASPPYFVKSMTLLQTTAVFAPTNEVCSFSNGSLANCRVVNLARSPNPQFYIRLKLPINIGYDRILILKSAVEEFIKARPREWLSLNGFRAERIQASEGWIEYYVIAQARGTWQDLGQSMETKANLSSYCHEVTKQLGINYVAPPLPVDLKYQRGDDDADVTSVECIQDPEARIQRFRSMALTAHNIRYN